MNALARQPLSGSTALNATHDTTTETTMTDTRHAGLITPGNAPHLADLNDDNSPYPALLAIFCDDCAFEHSADYLVPADSTKAERFEIARDHLRSNLGWICDGSGDYCPDCVKARATAPYETKTDHPECPDCGNGCGGHALETYHVDCGENVANCACPNRPAPAGRSLILGEINAERFRQIEKFGEQHREDGVDPHLRYIADNARKSCQAHEAKGGATWNDVLSEEYYEAVTETDQAKLRAELVQVAAVCVAWVEDIDSRTPATP